MVSDLLDARNPSKEEGQYNMQKEIMAVATTVFLDTSDAYLDLLHFVYLHACHASLS